MVCARSGSPRQISEGQVMPELVPVDYDPFAGSAVAPAAAPQFEPVDHDPFAKQKKSRSAGRSCRSKTRRARSASTATLALSARSNVPSRCRGMGHRTCPTAVERGHSGFDCARRSGAEEALAGCARLRLSSVRSPRRSVPAVRLSRATDAIPKITVRPSAVPAAQTAVELGAPLPRASPRKTWVCRR